MGRALLLRGDYDAAAVRGLARTTKHADQARRLLALAAIYDFAEGSLNPNKPDLKEVKFYYDCEMIDKKLWDECLKDFSGASCKNLLIGTGIDDLDISSCEKKEIFKEFLIYGMKKTSSLSSTMIVICQYFQEKARK